MKGKVGLLFWLLEYSILEVGLGAVLSGAPFPLNNDERFLDVDPNDLASYEIITPIKVTSTGGFVSHDLTHAHEHNVGGLAKGSSKRRKRGVKQLNGIAHYSIPIGGENHLVELEPNHMFLAPSAVVERRSKFDPELHEEESKIGNVSSRTSVIGRDPRCHFVGRVFNHTSSKVALSTCDGLKGFLKTRHGEYLIEPLQGLRRAAGQPHLHKIYRRSLLTPQPLEHKHAEGTCGTENFEDALKKREIWENERRTNRVLKGMREDIPELERHRSKRSVSVERNVEVMVVADKKMIDFYSNEDLNTYILTIMNMVSSIYHDASIGNAVNIIVVRIMLLETPQYEEELDISHDADDTLVSFCKWQQMINPASESHPHHHDVAVLLTRYNICSRSNAHCSTLGLAEIAGMCQPHRSCNVNEDTGLQIAYTIAHEIGHNFGMNHDSVVNGCGTSYGVSQHVMSPHLSTDAIPITWSNCSRSEITTFLDREWGTCLVDEPHEVEYNFPQRPPGTMYDANHQCRLAFGANAFHCDGIELECQTLWCRVDNRCVTRLEPAAEGTQCGKHKWCSSGKCVTMGDRPAAIHGNWGQWSAWSACSRSCGAGVEVATRLCDNPPPANGGKYCTGDRRRYRICNTEECPESAVSFRSIQCSAFDHKPYKEQNYTWAPVTLESSPCQLNCKPDNEFYSVELKDSVVDGTPCRPGTRDMCIHGICKRVSCDWTIEGTAQEDRCGLCHGDGTQCVTTGGYFNQTNGVSYVEVVTFPEGALNVRVEEAGDAANYFAIKDKQSGAYYLNGNWIIQWSGEYSAAGVMMYYKRENETETLFLPGPLKKALTLMLLFQTENPGLHWEYTTPHENATYTPEFHWHSSDWSVCTGTCGGGTQVSKAQCLEKEAGLVEDKYCEKEQRPEDKKRECNTHACPAWWWAGPWQPCSVTCGDYGNRRRTVICVKSYGPTEQMALMDSDCSMTIKPHEEEECPDLSPCQTDFSWSVGQWIETCRGDPCEFERREVRCQETVAPCDPLTKPPERRQCGNITCGHWEAHQWGQCSATCGEGVQIRIVECIDGVACSQANEPGSVRECKMAECHVITESLSLAHDSEETVPEVENDVESSVQRNETKETFPDEISPNSPMQEMALSKEQENEPNVNVTSMSVDVHEHPLDDSLNEIIDNSEEVLETVDDQEVSGTATEVKNNTTEDVLKEEDTAQETVLDTLLTENKDPSSTPKVVDVVSINKTEGTEEKYQTHAEEGTPKTNELSDNNESIGEVLNNVSEDAHPQESTDKPIVDSKIKSTPESLLYTPIKDSDYETVPDDYYEFDPQETEVDQQAPPKEGMTKNSDDERNGETDEIKTALEDDLDTTLDENVSPKNTGKVVKINNEEEQETIMHSDSNINKEVQVSNTVKEEVEDKQSEIVKGNEIENKDQKNTTEHENNKQVPNIEANNEETSKIENGTNETTVTKIEDKDDVERPRKTSHNMTKFDDSYDYYSDDEYYDDYYYDPSNDYNSTNDNSTTNKTLIARPDGFIEDKLDIDSVQVIELRMKKNKRGGKKKYRHKKNRKEKIRKVKIHTGADAIRVLNKLSKRGNAKKPKNNNKQISDSFTDEALGSIYKWTIGQWSECSEPCGGGHQKRSVECQSASSGQIVPSWECHSLRPSDLQNCNVFKCLNWSLSDYGPCSATCGTGTRLRSATCPQDDCCHPQDIPQLVEECEEGPCVKWVEGPWSMCTKSCDGGYQIRYVKCVDARTQEASQDCVEDRPPHKRVCNANHCQNKSQGQQHHCKDSLDTKLCRRLVHMCTTKFFRIKCCKTCLRHRG